MENTPPNPENIINLIVFFVLMALLLAVTVVFIFTYSKKRILGEEIKRNELELKHKTQMLHAIITAQEEERRIIARDLHDDIGSTLNIIHLNANRIAGVASITNDEKTVANSIVSLTSKTIQSTRQISHRLLPPVLEKFGIGPALQELFDDVALSGSITTHCQLQVNEEHLTEDQKLNIFRISQELVNNSIRHGKATEISLEVAESDKGLYYSYHDNGKGFDLAKASKGLGLTNIENRAEMLNGNIKFKAEEGKGMSALLLIKFAV
jgi:signal transduction histidine kinase